MKKQGIVLLLLFAVWAGPDFAQNPDPKPARPVGENVVYLRAVLRRFSAAAPHLQPEITERTGSAFFLKDGILITDLDTVRSAVLVEIRRDAASTFERARVLFQAPDAGLAVLRLETGDFPAGVEIDERRPAAGSEISILGFDARTKFQEIRKAVVSEIGRGPIAGSDTDFHSMIIPASQSGLPGSLATGGPVVVDGKVTGVYIRPQEGRPYILSASVFLHVLEDIKDGRYDGFPALGFRYGPAAAPTLRRYLGLGADVTGGVVIERVNHRSAAAGLVQPGDILLTINGKAVNPYGRLADEPGIPGVDEYAASLQAGAFRSGAWQNVSIPLEVLRTGNKRTLTLPLESEKGRAWKRKSSYDDRRYALAAGLVLQELDFDLFHTTAVSTRSYLRYRYYHHDTDNLADTTDRTVILTGVLDDPVNLGASDFLYGAVADVNGHRVRSLEDFIREWKAAQERFVVIKFHDHPIPFVMQKDRISEAEKRIDRKYRPQENGREL